MPTIDPTPERFRALPQALPAGQPVTMLNLLKFRAQAEYKPGSGEPARSGRDAYREYARHAVVRIHEVGGRVVWQGDARLGVIAPEGEDWDEVLLVEYPSVEAFVTMVRSPAYQAFTHHRTAALADARLVAMQRTDAAG